MMSDSGYSPMVRVTIFLQCLDVEKVKETLERGFKGSTTKVVQSDTHEVLVVGTVKHPEVPLVANMMNRTINTLLGNEGIHRSAAMVKEMRAVRLGC